MQGAQEGYQCIRAECIVRLHFLELGKVLLHADVDLSCQLVLQNCPRWLKGHMPRLCITQLDGTFVKDKKSPTFERVYRASGNMCH